MANERTIRERSIRRARHMLRQCKQDIERRRATIEELKAHGGSTAQAEVLLDIYAGMVREYERLLTTLRSTGH